MRAGHVEVDLSDRRRVLLCPDVHGAFPALRDRLRQLRWDPAQDALVLLGDLADRGPASAEAPEWTTREGVLRVLGNHDEMPAMLLRREIGPREARMMGGAGSRIFPQTNCGGSRPRSAMRRSL